MSESQDIDVAMVNPFLASAGDVFRQMLGCELTKERISIRKDPSSSNEVAVIIGITGDAFTGVVVFGLKSHAAKKMVTYLDASIVNDRDKAFSDALGEVANIIAGNAMTIFTAQGLKLDITTPTVIVGSAFDIHLMDQATLCAEMNSPFGGMEINVAIKKLS